MNQLAPALAIALALRPIPQGWTGDRVHLEAERATLDYEAGDLTDDEAQAFLRLADRGITDIESLVAASLPGPPPERVRYIVSPRVGISRSFRRTVLLPLDRVRSRTAPYLHETTHVLVPSHSDCVWLNEGLASYMESRVAESLGGYDAHVFARSGNAGIDSDARRYLEGDSGRNVLPWVGLTGAPPRLEEDRSDVARPFYVLSQSFVKYLVASASLDAIVHAATDEDPGATLARLTGRSTEQWRAAWLVAIKAPALAAR